MNDAHLCSNTCTRVDIVVTRDDRVAIKEGIRVMVAIMVPGRKIKVNPRLESSPAKQGAFQMQCARDRAIANYDLSNIIQGDAIYLCISVISVRFLAGFECDFTVPFSAIFQLFYLYACRRYGSYRCGYTMCSVLRRSICLVWSRFVSCPSSVSGTGSLIN